MDFSDFPQIIVNFLSYKLNIQVRSQLTVNEYAIDLRSFFRYIIAKRTGVAELDADISIVDAAFADSITSDEIYGYLLYLAQVRKSKATTRSRKLATIRSFYKYHTAKSHLLKNDPAKDVDAPRLPAGLPIVMTLDEAELLLNSYDKTHVNYKRDYLITLMFLSCGMRLSELVGINLSDIDSDFSRFIVRGKGNKTRALYFNDVCKAALVDYIGVRQKSTIARGRRVKDTDALFLSRNGVRMSAKTVQWMLNKQLELCGLDKRGYSAHKLRHTAATLLYNESHVDVMMLKEILGHSQLSTTQIYTHVKSEAVKKALENSPFNVKHQDPAKKKFRKKDREAALAEYIESIKKRAEEGAPITEFDFNVGGDEGDDEVE